MTAPLDVVDAIVLNPTMASHGGSRVGAGRKSIFPTKAVPKPFAMDFTADGRRRLRALARRTKLSRNAVVGVLALQFADQLAFDAAGVVFPDKAHDVLSIRVPPNAAAKLRAARRRTGKSYSDLGEALIRQFGDVARFPPAPAPKRRRRAA